MLTDHGVTEILERLTRVDDPAEAASLVLELGLRGSGLERGAVVLRIGDRYRVVGVGLPDQALREIRRAASDEDTPLGQVFAGAGRLVMPAPNGRDDAWVDRIIALPFSDQAAPRGVVLLEGEEVDAQAEALHSVFERCAHALERTARIAELEAQVSRLDRQRDLMTSIINSLPDPVLLTDAANNIVLANDRAEHIFSTVSSDSEGRRRAVELNNLLFSSFLTQSVISSGGGKARELNLVDPSDGSDLLFEVLPAPVPPSVASEGSVLSILRNITDLKRALTELETQFHRSRVAEERVREEWERLNATLENVGDPILVTDQQSNIILTNGEAERLFEVPAGEGSESALRRAVRANDTKFTSLMSDFLLHPGTRRIQKIDLEDVDLRREFPVEVVSSKIMNTRGEPTAVVSVLHDLTQVEENRRLAAELKTLNEELEDRIRRATVELEERNRRLEWQSRELEKASRLKSEFLASMSHELRTPINAVLGYTSLMREEIYGELTAKQAAALDKINSASQHLLDLINDILDLSKIEAGKMPLYLEEVSLPQVISELAEAVDPLVREKALKFECELEDDLPTLHTDRTKLKQVILNLLSNAIKFTSEGSVRVSAERTDDDRVRVTVTDTGIGIRKEELDKIFEDFRQVDQSPTREYGGTGLGLSITRKLLALMDGTISVSSAYGEGSTFTLTLPLRIDEPSRDEQAQRAITPQDVRRSADEIPGAASS